MTWIHPFQIWHCLPDQPVLQCHVFNSLYRTIFIYFVLFSQFFFNSRNIFFTTLLFLKGTLGFPTSRSQVAIQVCNKEIPVAFISKARMLHLIIVWLWHQIQSNIVTCHVMARIWSITSRHLGFVHWDLISSSWSSEVMMMANTSIKSRMRNAWCSAWTGNAPFLILDLPCVVGLR